MGIKKKEQVDFYHYRVVVYRHCQRAHAHTHTHTHTPGSFSALALGKRVNTFLINCNMHNLKSILKVKEGHFCNRVLLGCCYVDVRGSENLWHAAMNFFLIVFIIEMGISAVGKQPTF